MLGALSPSQVEARTRMQNYRSSAKLKELKLEAFIEPSKLSFEDMMEYFIPSERLKRAQSIEDSELKIIKQTESRIEAAVREYHITIDLEKREILHDCADWNKTLPARRLCKHVGKLLLTMDRGKAAKLLRALYAEKESWQFKPYT